MTHRSSPVRVLYAAAGIIALGIICLLVFSLDRTGWLLSVFERGADDSPAAWFGIDSRYLGLLAAGVAEVAAITLICSDSVSPLLADEQTTLRRWGYVGLGAIITTQVLAGLLAGYDRGWDTITALTGSTSRVALAIAGLIWLVANLLVPLLNLVLSLTLAAVIRRIVVLSQTPDVTAVAQLTAERDQLTAERDQLLVDLDWQRGSRDQLTAERDQWRAEAEQALRRPARVETIHEQVAAPELLTLVDRLRAEDLNWPTVERITGLSRSTIERRRKAATNGHLKEAIS